MVRQDAEKDLRKDIAENMKEAFEMSKAQFNRLVKVSYENTLDEQREQLEGLEFLHEIVTGDVQQQNDGE